MFQIGELVIYGTEGVCRITAVETMKVGTTRREYYVLKPVLRGSSTVYVPKDNEALRPKMRRLLSVSEIEELIRSVTQEETVWIEDNSERKAEYQKILAEGERTGLMRMIRALYERRRFLRGSGKQLRSGDDQLLRDAERLLNDEFAAVLEISPHEVPDYIRSKMQLEA